MRQFTVTDSERLLTDGADMSTENSQGLRVRTEGYVHFTKDCKTKFSRRVNGRTVSILVHEHDGDLFVVPIRRIKGRFSR